MKTLLTILLALLGAPVFAKPPLIFAAASLQESMNAAADAWAAKGHERPVISFAGSSTLARQIAAGAPADIFVSADEEWMDDVAKKGLIRPATRRSFLTNRIVLIAPAGSKQALRIARNFPLLRALGDGKLAMADTEAVPAGKYGKAALTALGVWTAVAPHVARADNVRAALLLVDRGAAPFGIVYATDAKAAPGVRVVDVFPANSHPPITYPIAAIAASQNPEAEGFRRFLLSQSGRAIFVRYGFGTR
ncbi:molybdate ABC transporter substrate-binding protein [Sphingomonas crocodyli]|uniref:Molybdate ABC transporter substrate-binding protein n=1 Tax=Sphingomonas crocodyli TaxID=1979270 RepID=A0A437M5H2_9SPHN|nr:molybdate ABC transporter substrate-binding protein [Sphingomonas crocodyli]RVT92826.1 molybdate ABC transporter substrate-binding protein [Sphingomonas crocodyli]